MRLATVEDRSRFAYTCRQCGLTFLSGRVIPEDQEHPCPGCESEQPAPEAPGGALAHAMEREVCAALSVRWQFVTSAALTRYLDRLARQIGARIEHCPRDVRVVLVDDGELRTLALPSGLLLISLGTLAALHDEAELAFVLGHELAHASSSHAAEQLVRCGYHAVTREGRLDARDPWVEAVLDLVRVGYGRHRERDADARALKAILELGYDPDSVLRYLHRIEVRIERGESEVAELAAAHPPPSDRIVRIEKQLFGHVTDRASRRVNREVFRRVAGRDLLDRGLVPCELDIESGHGPVASSPWRGARGWWLGVGVGVVAVAILALAWWLAS